MNVTHVVFDVESFGVTHKSLKILRDALAERSTHHILGVKVPTNEICCGYLIFDLEWQGAIWTGDGFRLDYGGEGGAGQKAAEALFNLFGIQPIPWRAVNMNEIYSGPEEEVQKMLTRLAQQVANELTAQEVFRPKDREPDYLKWA